ncbi:DUF2795 domain-containing protein [Okeanomitos corallinicola TIOX110]|uniref:DUF2795 domain-containing protein n=1 Tax=Okeanomitos corallinicola TIOX110 TaxID=3133117 RepID=A0ABZ2UMF8_9CYAN
MTKANPVSVQKHLKGVSYPANKEELIKHARKHGADQEVLSLLERLPENQQFGNPAELNKAMGKIR